MYSEYALKFLLYHRIRVECVDSLKRRLIKQVHCFIHIAGSLKDIARRLKVLVLLKPSEFIIVRRRTIYQSNGEDTKNVCRREEVVSND